MIALLLSGIVFAANSSPCQEDIQKLCNNVSPGAGAVVDCMKEKNSKGLLSAACKQYLELILEENRKPSQLSRKKNLKQNTCIDICQKMPKGSKGRVQCSEAALKEPQSCLVQ